MVIQSEEEFENSQQNGPNLIYGSLITEDPVTIPNDNEEYIYIRKAREEYKFTPYLDPDAEPEELSVRARGIYQWVETDVEVKQAQYCEIYDLELQMVPNAFADAKQIKVEQISDNERYVYYGIPVNTKGTMFVKLGGNEVTEASVFCIDIEPEEFLNIHHTHEIPTIIFVLWLLYFFFALFNVFPIYRGLKHNKKI